MMLLEKQGKEVDTWSAARHAYECCQAYGGEGLMTISEYAGLRGWASHSRVSQQIQAASLAKNCVNALTHLSVKAATQISTVPEDVQPLLVDLHIKHEWGEKERVAAIKAVKSIQIPEELQSWLDPQHWTKQVIKDQDLAPKVMRWVGTAFCWCEHMYSSIATR